MMMLKNIIFSLCLLSCFVLANISLKPEDILAEKAKVILTVAIEEIDYFPYNYKENGEIKGLTIDFLNYIEANSKYDFEFVMLPWPRALHLVAEGKVDLILTLFKNKKREKIYHFIEPSYGYEVNQFFTLSNSKIEFNGQLQQLSSYTIGTKRQFSYGKNFDQANYLTKLPTLTEDTLLKLLLSRRIDIAISNPYVFHQLISNNNVSDQITAIEPYVAKTPVYLGLTKGREDAQKIKAALGKLTLQFKASAYYQELLNKYQLNFK
jgi:polar amino acid transport system substrate-binding protein